MLVTEWAMFPRRTSLSAIQHVLCASATNHIMKQHFSGDQDFQILFHGPKNSDQIKIESSKPTSINPSQDINSFPWLLNSHLYISIPIKRSILNMFPYFHYVDISLA